MIKVTLTNEILKRISEIDEKRFSLSTIEMPPIIKNRLRKNSKKKSSYASNKIEGNPLTEKQANEAIDSDSHKHFLKPEQEVRNYFLALNFLEEKLKKKEAFSKEMILEVQAMVEKGASKEKIGLRGPMQPGMLFAVYDSETGAAEYIPPEYIDIPDLLDELVEYVNTTDDHPLIIAAVVHYQLVTIHPFEDGNGRTARLMSGYILDYYGYGFNGIGSLEEYFAYDPDQITLFDLMGETPAPMVQCRVDTKKMDCRTAKSWTDRDWMEWQANALSSAVLMPVSMVRMVAENFKRPGLQQIFYHYALAEEVASIFNVSFEAAGYRLKQLGYIPQEAHLSTDILNMISFDLACNY